MLVHRKKINPTSQEKNSFKSTQNTYGEAYQKNESTPKNVWISKQNQATPSANATASNTSPSSIQNNHSPRHTDLQKRNKFSVLDFAEEVLTDDTTILNSGTSSNLQSHINPQISNNWKVSSNTSCTIKEGALNAAQLPHNSKIKNKLIKHNISASAERKTLGHTTPLNSTNILAFTPATQNQPISGNHVS